MKVPKGGILWQDCKGQSPLRLRDVIPQIPWTLHRCLEV